MTVKRVLIIAGIMTILLAFVRLVGLYYIPTWIIMLPIIILVGLVVLLLLTAILYAVLVKKIDKVGQNAQQ
jgi:hypothetical protein